MEKTRYYKQMYTAAPGQVMSLVKRREDHFYIRYGGWKFRKFTFDFDKLGVKYQKPIQISFYEYYKRLIKWKIGLKNK
ncbi:MAG: hypothetical protein ABFS35_23565 [Bacteroidota bacterium]